MVFVPQQQPEHRGLLESLRRDSHLKCLALTILMLACLGVLAWCRVAEVTKHVLNFHSFPIASTRRVSPCDEGYVYIPVAVLAMLYLVYLVECWHCGTRLELVCKVDASAAYRHVLSLREAAPVVWWKAVCYHYVRRTRHVTRYRNGDAYTTTQVYYERINSHAAGASFSYAGCGVQDVSKCLVDLDKHPAIKIRFSKGFAFANLEAAAEFEEQRRRFFQDNERVDDYLEMREGLDLIGVNFQEYMVTYPDKLPWYVSHAAFWILSLLLLSWPFRVMLQTKTAFVHYQVNKLFGVNYGSRGSISDSAEIERCICADLSLAPSYSEAMLFSDPNGNVPSQHGVRRFSMPRSLLPSNSRSSLRVVYFSSPLSEPPDYEEAIRLSQPISFLRRSITDRDFPSRAPPIETML